MLEYVVDVVDAGAGAAPADAAPRRAGAAPPRAVVGGVDYAVGGWGEYEINRRRAQWEEAQKRRTSTASARVRYPGRTYVSAEDAVRSIMAGSRAAVGGGGAGGARSALQRAALHLADALGRLEDRLCDPDDDGVWECAPVAALSAPGARYLTVPPVTSADLRAFARDPAQEADPESMYDLSEDVTALVAATGVVLPPLPGLADRRGLPALPARVVPIANEEGVLRLEAATAPYVSSLEGLQASLATRLDAAATALAAALREAQPP
jgi:hypothetical protein